MSLSRAGLSSVGLSGGAGDLVSFKDMPSLAGGEYDSDEAKRLCRVIRERLKCLDEINGTCYLSNFDESVCEGSDEASAEKRRKLIESVAVPMCGGSMEAPVSSCMRNLRAGKVAPVSGGGAKRSVRFAAGVSERSFDESQPVHRPHPLAAGGVRLEDVAPVLFTESVGDIQGGISNCASNPGFSWTPGSKGPDGMGYCPDDYAPGTVQPGFDRMLYQVSVTKDGKRVWTSAANKPVTYDIRAPGFAQHWPRHVPRQWLNYGYDTRFSKAAYSFLPFEDQVAALNYLIKSNEPCADSKKTTAEKEKEAEATKGDSAKAAAQKAKNATAAALLDKLINPDNITDMLSMEKDGKGLMFKTDQSYKGGIVSADGVDYPSGTGMMHKDGRLYIGRWGGNAETMLMGGGDRDRDLVFNGVELWFVGGTPKIRTRTKTVGGDPETNEATVYLTGELKGATGLDSKTFLAEFARGVVFPVDGVDSVGGLAVEVHRKTTSKAQVDPAEPSLTIAIGKYGKINGVSRVVEGWMNTVARDGNNPVKFKLDGTGKPEVIDMYFGEVNSFGIPDGSGRLSSSIAPADLEKGVFEGTAHIGRFVLGEFAFGIVEKRSVTMTTVVAEDGKKTKIPETSNSTVAQGFFLDGSVFGSAEFKETVETSSELNNAIDAGAKAADAMVAEIQKAMAAAEASAASRKKIAVATATGGVLAGIGLGALAYAAGYGAAATAGAAVAPVAAGLMIGAFIWSRRKQGPDKETANAINSLVALSHADSPEEKAAAEKAAADKAAAEKAAAEKAAAEKEAAAAASQQTASGGALGGGFRARYLLGGDPVTYVTVNIELMHGSTSYNEQDFHLERDDDSAFSTLADVKATMKEETTGMDMTRFDYLNVEGVAVQEDDAPIDDLGKKGDGGFVIRAVYRLNEEEVEQIKATKEKAAEAAEAAKPKPIGTGKVEAKLAHQVRLAQQALADMTRDDGSQEAKKAVAALKKESDSIFRSGQLAIELEGDSFSVAADNVAYLVQVREILTNAAGPCKILSEYRQNGSRYVRQSAYVLTMKVLALLQYIGTSTAFSEETIGFDVNEVIDEVFACLKKISLACFCQIRDGAVSEEISSPEQCDKAEIN